MVSRIPSWQFLIGCFCFSADVSAGKQVKGWFPRACIHPFSLQYSPDDLPYDSPASDTQVSTHSDSQYSQISESDQDSPSDRTKKKKKLRSSDNENSPLHVSGEGKPKKAAAKKASVEVTKTKKTPKKDLSASVKGVSQKEMTDLKKMAASGSPSMVTRKRKK